MTTGKTNLPIGRAPIPPSDHSGFTNNFDAMKKIAERAIAERDALQMKLDMILWVLTDKKKGGEPVEQAKAETKAEAH